MHYWKLPRIKSTSIHSARYYTIIHGTSIDYTMVEYSLFKLFVLTNYWRLFNRLRIGKRVKHASCSLEYTLHTNWKPMNSVKLSYIMFTNKYNDFEHYVGKYRKSFNLHPKVENMKSCCRFWILERVYTSVGCRFQEQHLENEVKTNNNRLYWSHRHSIVNQGSTCDENFEWIVSLRN